MKRLLIPALMLMVLFVSGCASPTYVSGWKKIKVGMPRDEVAKTLGKPIVALPPVPVGVPSENDESPLPLFKERWMYGKEAPSVSEKTMFSLYFDIDGRLVSYRPPLEGPYKRMPSSDQKSSK